MNQYANDFNKTVVTYYNDLKKYKPLSKSKEKRLIRLSKKGNINAQNKLLEANLKFVFDVAKHYSGRGVPIADLISEGNLGLIKAIEKFDESKDVKFISYAVWWIKQGILEALKKRRMLNFVEINHPSSNKPIFENKILDEEDEIYDNDVSSNNIDEEKQETKKVEKEVISYLLENLSNREKEIIVSYYGLNDNQELTLYEIGEKMGLSAERVRQIKKVSMRKLRTKALLCEEIEEIFP